MTYRRRVTLLSALLMIMLSYQNCAKNESNQNTVNASTLDKANFTWINENIVLNKCESCHNNSLAFAGLNFTSYEGIIKTIEPGVPEESVFYTRSFSTTFFELTDQEREIIYLWIQNGAPQD